MCSLRMPFCLCAGPQEQTGIKVIILYCTSTQFKLLNESELASLERKGKLKLPGQYRNFMKTYGSGTYGGAICINFPDFDILKEFAECDFWQYENAPITQEQLNECVVIGNSIDGDYIAVHAKLDGYILLPRHSNTIVWFPCNEEEFIDTVNKIGYCLYHENLENYFEPVGNHHLFLRSAGRDLHNLAERFKSVFKSDYLIENEYTCEVFIAPMGGYVRFNLAYGFEVVIYYSDYGMESFQEIKKFLNENGCN